jgi:integrase
MDGKRKRKYIYGKTRREVAERLKELQRDHQLGLPMPSDRQTVGDFLTKWLEEAAKPSVRASTFVSYRGNVNNHLIPALGRIRLAELTAQDLHTLYNHKIASGLSPRSVQYIHAVLRRALGKAVKWGLVGRNVAALVDPPKVQRTEIEPWTLDQARSFLATVRGDRLEALFTVALSVGLRRGEALGLSWKDVDLEQGSITVRAGLQRIDGKLQLLETKTDRSRRTIPLPVSLVLALRGHRLMQEQSRLWAGDKWKESGLVFTTSIGTPIEPRNLNRSFQKAVERAGLPHTRFHDLRHTCATLLLAQGVGMRVIMDVLGHSKISVTMDVYAHVLPALQRNAAERMESALFG